MIDVRRQARGSRFRAGWRLSALVAWVTTVAVLFAQGIAPSYAEISVSTIGSADSVRMDILAWRAGMPSRVAAYLPDRMDPVVTDVDPAMLRGARLVEKGTSGGWTYGALLTAGGALPATMDVSYRQTPSGLDTVTTNPADPTRTIAIHMPPPGPEEPQVIDPITWTSCVRGLHRGRSGAGCVVCVFREESLRGQWRQVRDLRRVLRTRGLPLSLQGRRGKLRLKRAGWSPSRRSPHSADRRCADASGEVALVDTSGMGWTVDDG